MITTYCPVNGEVQRFTGFVTAEHFEQAAWIDLLSPTSDEEQHIESLLRVDLPTREEMRAIEDSMCCSSSLLGLSRSIQAACSKCSAVTKPVKRCISPLTGQYVVIIRFPF